MCKVSREMNKEQLCVIFGNPVAQSKSPEMQKQFAKNAGIHLEYLKVLAPIDSFSSALKEWLDKGIVGANITIPFKEDILKLCDHLTEEATLAQAVNTIRIENGLGLLRDITEVKQQNLTGKRVLVLGAGGAVRGILKPLLDRKPSEVIITNRTLSRAEGLASEFSRFGNIEAVSWQELTGAFDFIINATSASLQSTFPELPKGVIADFSVGYDLVYGNEPTSFMHYFLEEGGTKVFDGLGMLIEQGVYAFEFWFNVTPSREGVLEVFGRAE